MFSRFSSGGNDFVIFISKYFIYFIYVELLLHIKKKTDRGTIKSQSEEAKSRSHVDSILY